MSELDVKIRAYEEGDLNLILTTWLKGAYYGSWMRNIDSEAYFKMYPAVIKDILRRCLLNVRIACYADAPEVVLGYLVTEPALNLTHFAYVKPEFRGKGILRRLVGDTIITQVSHITGPGKAIIRKKNLKFNPFLA